MPPLSLCLAVGLTMDAPSVIAPPAAVMTKLAAEKVGHFQTKGGGALVDTIGSWLVTRTLGFGAGVGANSFGSSAGAGGSAPSRRGASGGGASGLDPGSLTS